MTFLFSFGRFTQKLSPDEIFFEILLSVLKTNFFISCFIKININSNNNAYNRININDMFCSFRCIKRIFDINVVGTHTHRKNRGLNF